MMRIMSSMIFMMSVILTAFMPQKAKAEDKPVVLRVKLNYTGAGAVDQKHKIQVFLFDSPDFKLGGVRPLKSRAAASKNAAVTFASIAKPRVWIAAVYDPSGKYNGASRKPPSGASVGMYSKTPGVAEGVDIEAGKTAEIQLSFDDSNQMP